MLPACLVLPEQMEFLRPYIGVHNFAFAWDAHQASHRFERGGFARSPPTDDAVEVLTEVHDLTRQEPTVYFHAQDSWDGRGDLVFDTYP